MLLGGARWAAGPHICICPRPAEAPRGMAQGMGPAASYLLLAICIRWVDLLLLSLALLMFSAKQLHDWRTRHRPSCINVACRRPPAPGGADLCHLLFRRGGSMACHSAGRSGLRSAPLFAARAALCWACEPQAEAAVSFASKGCAMCAWCQALAEGFCHGTGAAPLRAAPFPTRRPGQRPCRISQHQPATHAPNRRVRQGFFTATCGCSVNAS